MNTYKIFKCDNKLPVYLLHMSCSFTCKNSKLVYTYSGPVYIFMVILTGNKNKIGLVFITEAEIKTLIKSGRHSDRISTVKKTNPELIPL